MRVQVVKAPGYQDGWTAELITYLRSIDGRSIAVLEADDKSWHVIESQHVREWGNVSGGYVDTSTPADVGREDRAYWDDKYSDESEDTDNDE